MRSYSVTCIINVKGIRCTIWTIQLQTLQYETLMVACIIDKSPLVGEHAFPLTEIVCWMAHSTILLMPIICVV